MTSAAAGGISQPLPAREETCCGVGAREWVRPAWRSRPGLGVTALHPVGSLRRPEVPPACGFAVAWTLRRAPFLPKRARSSLAGDPAGGDVGRAFTEPRAGDATWPGRPRRAPRRGPSPRLSSARCAPAVVSGARAPRRARRLVGEPQPGPRQLRETLGEIESLRTGETFGLLGLPWKYRGTRHKDLWFVVAAAWCTAVGLLQPEPP